MSEKKIYHASLVERSFLTKPGSGKVTQHLVLKVPCELTYEVGDSLAVYPENSKEDVDALLSFFEDTLIQDLRTNEWRTLSKHLTSHANIQELSRGLVKITNVPVPEDRKAFKKYLKAYTLREFFEQHTNLSISTEELVSVLGPMLPRFYSIASSPSVHPGEVHLTVALVEYDLDGKKRKGIATDYLCNNAPMNSPTIPVYIQPNRGFTIPENADTPIIMIGPGTGVAPFRAFMQERVHRGSKGKHWLFFGERTSKHEFFYEEYWKGYVQKGLLDLDCAFSRDQEEKVYVQHRMKEKKEKFLEWIEEGAHLYLCGDAQRMAKDVENTLLEIFMEGLDLSKEDALLKIKEMRREGRYHRDVY